MSAYRTNSASASSKKENKLVRSVKPPKTGLGAKRSKAETATEDRVATDDTVTKLGNREKGNLKGQNIGIESSVEPSSILSNNIKKVVNSIKASSLAESVNINGELETKCRSQNDKDKIISNSTTLSVASSPSVETYNMKEYNTSFEPSTQAIKLKKDNKPKGTALSTKATRFNRQTNKKSLSMGKKVSVKQLDVNKVYLQ